MPAERLLDGRQETMQNTVHLGCNICGRTRSFQLRGQHRHGALAYVGEDDTDVPLPDRLSAIPNSPPRRRSASS